MRLRSVTIRDYRAFGASGATPPLDHEFVGLIGVNNSGKSSLLRALYELRPIFDRLAALESGDTMLHRVFGTGARLADPALQPGEKIYPAKDDRAEPRITLDFAHSEAPGRIDQLNLVYRRSGVLTLTLKLTDGAEVRGLRGITVISESGQTVVRGNAESGETYFFHWDEIRQELRWLTGCMYVGPFRNAINSGGGSYYDLAVGESLLTTFDNFKNGPSYRDNEAMEEMCGELARIFRLGRLEINVSADKKAFVYMVDGKSYRGGEQGGGISQFVIVAANVLVRRPTLLLIDEPELNIHASLQRPFLTLLARYVQGQVIFATHSLGLARSAADRVLVVVRDKDNRASVQDYRATPSLSSTLGELGYGGLNDSAYKAVLLVEGVTEVRVFQELLMKYGVRGEVVILSLGGDDLASGKADVELAELRRLSDTVFAVVDSERTSAAAEAADRRLQFQANCERQGIECCVLERTSIENYFDLDVAREVENCPGAPDFGYFAKPGREWGWKKERNWRIVERMTKEMIATTDLGQFIERLTSTVLRKD